MAITIIILGPDRIRAQMWQMEFEGSWQQTRRGTKLLGNVQSADANANHLPIYTDNTEI